MPTKHLLIVSFDAVSSEDIKLLKTLPHFSKFISKGSLIHNVHSIYPSLTYPAHTTIVTGNYPIHHGIINNTLLEPGKLDPNWYWYSKYIQGKTLFDLAHEEGLTTCSLLWPVTGRSKITYNLPEIFPTKKWHHQLVMSGLAGSLSYQLELNTRFGTLRQGTKQPYLDDFVMACAKHTLIKYKPNLMCVHLTDVDTHRHYTGYSSIESKNALIRHDHRLDEILAALKEADIYNETTVILLGDHDQKPVHSTIKLNKYFLDKGLIRCNQKGKIISYDVIAKSCDGACYIYTKNNQNLTQIKQITAMLDTLQLLPSNPIEKCFSKDEVIALGADANCDFMLEAKEGYYFVDDLDGDIIEPVNKKDIGHVPHRVLSAHGYLPSKSHYTTFFIAAGPGIKPKFVKEGGKLINHAPTLAHLLGLKLQNSDGQIEWSILNGVNT